MAYLVKNFKNVYEKNFFFTLNIEISYPNTDFKFSFFRRPGMYVRGVTKKKPLFFISSKSSYLFLRKPSGRSWKLIKSFLL